MVTVAPELPGGLELVRRLAGRGVVVSVGHSDADADFSEGSLYELLAARWEVRLRDADQRVVAVAIEADDAEALEVAPGSAGLRFQTLARDVEGTPVYYATSLYRGDRYEIDLTQVRDR